jgi:hypothetical protein
MSPQNSLPRFKIAVRIPLALLLTAGLLITASGCHLCCPPYMDDYATVGGRWSRMNPTDGRVGSAFSDPGVLNSNSAMDSFSSGIPMGIESEEIPEPEAPQPEAPQPETPETEMDLRQEEGSPNDLEASRDSRLGGLIILGH